tara:strand:+ start:92 stop:328 length:237 start_codon:yes stop_codon:yes gene_type:complete
MGTVHFKCFCGSKNIISKGELIMAEYFNDTNSVLIFVVGVVVTSLFIIGVWELMRESLTGIPGTLSMKISRHAPNESE